MTWKDDKNLGPWDFDKSIADNHYNEGDKIATMEDPVWSMEFSGVPITKTHTPCGYWLSDIVDRSVHFTSRPYPIEDIESLESLSAIITDGNLRAIHQQYNESFEDLESLSATITGGNLRALLKYYTNGLPEDLESLSATITGGELHAVMLSYTNGLPEDLESLSAVIAGGELDDRLIHYTNGLPEDLESNAAVITGGTLENG